MLRNERSAVSLISTMLFFISPNLCFSVITWYVLSSSFLKKIITLSKLFVVNAIGSVWILQIGFKKRFNCRSLIGCSYGCNHHILIVLAIIFTLIKY